MVGYIIMIYIGGLGFAPVKKCTNVNWDYCTTQSAKYWTSISSVISWDVSIKTILWNIHQWVESEHFMNISA